MKTAICIFGQVRDEFRALTELSKNFGNNQNVLFFYSTWDKSGAKVDGIYGLAQLTEIFGIPYGLCLPRHLTKDTLYTSFPDLRKKLLVENSIDQLKVRQSFPSVNFVFEDGDSPNFKFSKPTSDLNSKRMLHKWDGLIESVMEFEQQNQTTIDNILLIRSDRFVSHDFDLFQPMLPGTITFDKIELNSVGTRLISDMFIYGCKKDIAKLRELYTLAKNEPKRRWQGIHKELDLFIKDNSLNAAECEPGLIRKSTIPHGVNILHDFFLDPQNLSTTEAQSINNSIKLIEKASSSKHNLSQMVREITMSQESHKSNLYFAISWAYSVREEIELAFFFITFSILLDLKERKLSRADRYPFRVFNTCFKKLNYKPVMKSEAIPFVSEKLSSIYESKVKTITDIPEYHLDLSIEWKKFMDYPNNNFGWLR